MAESDAVDRMREAVKKVKARKRSKSAKRMDAAVKKVKARKQPNPRAVERANPNASFKRPTRPGPGTGTQPDRVRPKRPSGGKPAMGRPGPISTPTPVGSPTPIRPVVGTPTPVSNPTKITSTASAKTAVASKTGSLRAPGRAGAPGQLKKTLTSVRSKLPAAARRPRKSS